MLYIPLSVKVVLQACCTPDADVVAGTFHLLHKDIPCPFRYHCYLFVACNIQQ